MRNLIDWVKNLDWFLVACGAAIVVGVAVMFGTVWFVEWFLTELYGDDLKRFGGW